MLDKALRKHLLEQKDWDKALKAKHDSNPYQTWQRNRDLATRAMRDLIILMNSLREEKQAEVFNAQNVEPFIRTLLGLFPDSGFVHLSDERRISLATTLADISLKYCQLL